MIFTPRAPLVVEIRMTIDGKPFAAVRRELIDELLQLADRQHNGKPAWAAVLADPKRFFGGRTDLGIDLKNRREFLTAHDTNSNGLIDRDEARRFIAQVNRAGAAFAIDGSSQYRETNQRQSLLLALLDIDGDEVLSRAELAGAIDRLRSRDANDDEIVDLDEVRDAPEAGAMGMDPADMASVSPPAAARLGPHANWDAISYAFSELYTSGGEMRPDCFLLAPALAGELDADGDGALARDEIQRLDAVLPHLALEANFGRTGDLPRGLVLRSIAGELAESAGLRGADDVVLRVDGFALELPGVLLRFAWRDREPGADQGPSAETQLAALDADKNGYLEKSEVEGQTVVSGAPFDDWDADGDGKVYAAEIAAYDRRAKAPELSAVRATAGDDQDVLFPLLDIDQDGRLTGRELDHATERLGRLDRDGDGNLAYEELPASIGIVFERGGRQNSPRRAMTAPAAAASSSDAPSWFVYMDTNRDELVSRREFPGSRARFDALDGDRDGFIDVAEAQEADAGQEEDAPEEDTGTRGRGDAESGILRASPGTGSR